MANEKKCKYCGKLLVRREAGGKVEPARDFRRRQFCDKRCSSKFQHSGKGGVRAEVKVKSEEIETGSDDEKKSAAEYLSDVVNDTATDTVTRVNAAKALLPYQSKKVGEQGKKQTKGERAASAATGRFASGNAPRLVQGGKG